MPDFTLHDVPPAVWEQFRARAARDGWHLRSLIQQLMADYGADRISPTVPPTPKPYNGVVNKRCPRCLNAITTNLTKRDVSQLLAERAVRCTICAEPIPLSEQEVMELETWSRTPNPRSEPSKK